MAGCRIPHLSPVVHCPRCRCNGVEVRCLAHLAQLVLGSRDPYVRLELDRDKVVVIHAVRARECGEDILRQNCIPAMARRHRPLIALHGQK